MMNDDVLDDLRARLVALPSLTTAERLRELVALVTVELPRLIDEVAAPAPPLTVIERKGTQMLIHCAVCGQDHWEEDTGGWMARAV